ncbi:unnamed protein product (mitochondrion) [Plasmodiophora brassicae]|uniref:Glutamyl-tRNA(Gln) amidotransferase subunit B, mitochondrial n=1 Tax=Plasmodiophora brassicae TaxID=37360 RepID=A0A0G4J222_PLABS|nr:hypothetical protein PBRA_001951 [Plasmodiophora brassicae]SPR01373.1 unnamed protein product [Plasmodiophora brassicae]
MGGAGGRWQAKIGLEVHAQLQCARKLFSGSFVGPLGAAPNTHCTLFDAAIPGTLPRLNAEPVRLAVRAGIAFGGAVNLTSRFVRKHYFYCDLPLGYQITQQDDPIISGGLVFLPDHNLTVGIDRIQLEQDSGKSINDIDESFSYVDLNRAGMALIEIVTKPDMTTGEQAGSFLKKLQQILSRLDVCDGIMASGSMRCDVNVSVHDQSAKIDGERIEVKNLNSIRAVENAIAFETKRQIASFEQGRPVERETRSFDAVSGSTSRLRSKEQLADYRMFPDPDLPSLRLDKSFVDGIRGSMPEMPDVLVARLQTQYGISLKAAEIIGSRNAITAYFESMLQAPSSCPLTPETAAVHANWLTTELFGRLNAKGLDIDDCNVSPERLRSLTDAITSGVITGRSGKAVLDLMTDGDNRPVLDIIRDHGWEQVTDVSIIEPLCLDAIKAHPREVHAILHKNKYRKLNCLVGDVIAKYNGPGCLSTPLVSETLQRLMREQI